MFVKEVFNFQQGCISLIVNAAKNTYILEYHNLKKLLKYFKMLFISVMAIIPVFIVMCDPGKQNQS